MSAPWKAHMTYNRYASIAASAVRSALKPEQHAKAVRRGEQTLKYQDWKDGKGSDSVRRLLSAPFSCFVALPVSVALTQLD